MRIPLLFPVCLATALLISACTPSATQTTASAAYQTGSAQYNAVKLTRDFKLTLTLKSIHPDTGLLRASTGLVKTWDYPVYTAEFPARVYRKLEIEKYKDSLNFVGPVRFSANNGRETFHTIGIGRIYLSPDRFQKGKPGCFDVNYEVVVSADFIDKTKIPEEETKLNRQLKVVDNAMAPIRNPMKKIGDAQDRLIDGVVSKIPVKLTPDQPPPPPPVRAYKADFIGGKNIYYSGGSFPKRKKTDSFTELVFFEEKKKTGE